VWLLLSYQHIYAVSHIIFNRLVFHCQNSFFYNTNGRLCCCLTGFVCTSAVVHALMRPYWAVQCLWSVQHWQRNNKYAITRQLINWLLPDCIYRFQNFSSQFSGKILLEERSTEIPVVM
jgi:hypothetical protein